VNAGTHTSASTFAIALVLLLAATLAF
jgi:hypothetical protein